MIGPANESDIFVDDVKITALIDSGAQLSTITKRFAAQLGLKVQAIKTLLNVEGTGGAGVPYTGYVVANMKIPGVKAFDEEVFFLVINDSPYGEKVPVQVGTLAMDDILMKITDQEMAKLDLEWRKAKVSRLLASKAVKVAEEKAEKTGEFTLAKVKGDVKLTKDIVLGPFETVHAKGLTNVKGHDKKLNVITEGGVHQKGAQTINTYSVMHPQSRRVSVTLKNLSCRKITIPAKSVVAQVYAANAVPGLLVPKNPPEKDKKNSEEEPKAKEAQKKTEENPPQDDFQLPTVSPEKIEKLFSKLDLSGLEGWETEDKEEVKALLKEYASIFALDDLDLGKTAMVKHEIKLTDYTPFKERYRRIPPQQYEEVKKHLQEMLEVGAIRRSNSPWASAVVLVRKKDGSLRFCIDLRKLNARTIKDAYSLPRIDDTLDCLNGAQIFSSVDLKSGYWQVELDEASKALTAFTVGPLGFYECDRMPFGLTNAPATFQRLMESCLGHLHLTQCIIYLDDVIIYSKTPKEHIQRLRNVFDKLARAGLKLKPSKCEFFKKRITYLGHVVSHQGIETDPRKIEAIKKWPTPKTVTDVRSFLGFTNHYRRFIHKYAHIAAPLNILTSGENAEKKKSLVQWTPECEDAFQKLKSLCSQTPILAYADFSKGFRLHTDASGLGLGAVLYQKQDDQTCRVIAFASRTLTKTERKYPAHKLEFLALKWAVTDRFHEYLYGNSKFEVYTDNNPLTYILTSAKLDATGQRWVASLASYNFSLHYRSGKSNVEADALSRIPWEEEFPNKIEELNVKAIMNQEPLIVDSFMVLNGDADDKIILGRNGLMTNHSKYSLQDWKQKQEQDPIIGPVLKILGDKKNGANKLKEITDPLVKTLLRHRGNLIVRKGVLYKTVLRPNHQEATLQFVLPQVSHEQALKACHNDIGHLGLERSLDILRDRFFWPNMTQDMKSHIRKCDRCVKAKTQPEIAPLVPMQAQYPLEQIHVDYLTISSEKDRSQKINILVVTDHFTRYAQAFVTTSQEASVVAKTLWDKYFMHYGLPERIITDQGANFQSKLVEELCKLTRIKKLRTTPYHPDTNGSCERFNKTLVAMLSTIPEHAKYKWPDLVATLVHAYNCTKSNATGFSPFQLMYGRQPQLPIDIEFGVKPSDLTEVITEKYVKKLRSNLKWAYDKAKTTIKKEQIRAKRNHDRKVRMNKLEPGDKVLVRQKAKTGKKYKISDRWENTPYVVLEQRDSKLPVFKIQSLDNFAKIRILHRNMLFPLESELTEESMTNCADHDSPVKTGTTKGCEREPTTRRPITRSQTQKDVLTKANSCMLDLFNEDHKEPSPLKIERYLSSPIKIGLQAKANRWMWEYFDEDNVEEISDSAVENETNPSMLTSLQGVVNTTLDWFTR